MGLFLNGSAHPEVAEALRRCRRAFWSVGLFSGVGNLLMLAGSLYMLQVYDRVLSSRSVPTPVALSVFLVGAYAFQGGLDLIRSRLVVRIAALLDEHLTRKAHGAAVRLASMSRHAREAHQPLRDLDTIRAFLTGSGPIAMVDAAWIPVFLALCFVVHPLLGLVSLAGGIILFAMTLLADRAGRAPSRVAALDGTMRSALVDADRRNSETVLAMGMADVLTHPWSRVNSSYIAKRARTSDVTGGYSGISKVLRLLLQSAILGLGAYLVIGQELSSGAMIAASIMMVRALAPIETMIVNWRSFVSARQGVARLSEALAIT